MQVETGRFVNRTVLHHQAGPARQGMDEGGKGLEGGADMSIGIRHMRHLVANDRNPQAGKLSVAMAGAIFTETETWKQVCAIMIPARHAITWDQKVDRMISTISGHVQSWLNRITRPLYRVKVC